MMRKILALSFVAALVGAPAYADFTAKDASGATITFKNSGACSSVVCVVQQEPVDSTGTAFGVTGNPFFVSPASGATFPVSGSFWQATQPVSGTFWQATQPVSGTFWQTTQPVSIASMPSTPVTGTFWQTTQPVSLTSTTITGSVAVTNAGTFAVQAAQATAANLNATVVGTGTFVTQSVVTQGTSSNLKAQVDPLTIATWGLSVGTTPATAPTNTAIVGAIYNSSAPSPSTGQTLPLQLDSAGNLNVNIKAGAGSGGTAATDEASFTYGATSYTPIGGVYNSSITNLTSGQGGAVALTAARAATVDASPGSNLATLISAASPALIATAFNTNTYTTGQTQPMNADLHGNLYVNVGTLPAVNPQTAANWGLGATGAAVPANGAYVAALANSSEPTKATAGNLTGVLVDLAGKQVTSPYAVRESQLRCAVTLTATTSATTCTGMAAQGASIKIYITDLTCTRSDAATTSATLTLDDSATTIIDMPNNGGGGGFSHTYNTPLVVAANTAFTVQSGTSLTSVHCSASGFSGY